MPTVASTMSRTTTASNQSCVNTEIAAAATSRRSRGLRT
jgi:hypothetical protein